MANLYWLDAITQDEGSAFFRITPDLKRRRTVLAAKSKAKLAPHLKVV